MTLKTWLAEEYGRGARLSRFLNVPPSFVVKMASGEKPVPIAHGAAIEQFTGGAFSRREYWPDSYSRIWPELAQQASAAAAQPDAQEASHG